MSAQAFLEVVYWSRVASGLSVPDLYDLLDQCESRNLKQGITGLLVFNNRFFLQVLDGPQPAVARLMEHIQSDGRHHSVHVVASLPHQERRWGAWHSSHLGSTESQRQLLSWHHVLGVFDPKALTPADLRGLMQELHLDLSQT